MNIASLSNGSFHDLRINDVSHDGTPIEQSVWNNVLIDTKDKDASLKGVIFRNCQFTNCYFGNAKLDLTEAVFINCIIGQTTFMYGQLTGVSLRKTQIINCRIRNANMNKACVIDCRISETDFTNTTFRGAEFQNTELIGQEKWGWCSYEGALIEEKQKYKYFVARDIGCKLRAMRDTDEQTNSFISAIERDGFDKGEVMYIFSEWEGVLKFDRFVELAKKFGVGT